MGHLQAVCNARRKAEGTTLNLEISGDKQITAEEAKRQIQYFQEVLAHLQGNETRDTESREENKCQRVENIYAELQTPARNQNRVVENAASVHEVNQIRAAEIQRDIRVSFNGRKTVVKIDPGADVPVIGLETLLQLDEYPDIETTEIQLHAAGNKGLMVLGTLDVNLEIGKEQQEVTFVVIRETPPIMIDYESLGRFRYLLDPVEDCLRHIDSSNKVHFVPVSPESTKRIDMIRTHDIDEQTKHISDSVIKKKADSLLTEIQQVSAPPEQMNVEPVRLRLTEGPPITSKLRPCAETQLREVEKQTEEMLQK